MVKPTILSIYLIYFFRSRLRNQRGVRALYKIFFLLLAKSFVRFFYGNFLSERKKLLFLSCYSLSLLSLKDPPASEPIVRSRAGGGYLVLSSFILSSLAHASSPIGWKYGCGGDDLTDARSEV